jgi:Predicted drug exporters of the RND superfamily
VATFLYRLGKASYERAGRVLLAWVISLIAIAGGGFALSSSTDEEFRIPGSESQEAFDRLEAVFPAFAGASAQAVVVAPAGERLDERDNRLAIIRLTSAIDRLEGIEEAVHPFEEFAEQALSDDASTAYVQIQFESSAPEVSTELLEQLVATRTIAENARLTIEYGGTVFQDEAVRLTIAEVFGVIFSGLILDCDRSVPSRRAWMPLASCIIGV